MAIQAPSSPGTAPVMDLALEERPPVTGEELSKMGNIGRTELIKGEIVYMAPTGHLHGSIEGNLYAAIRAFVQQHGLGRAMVGEVGLYTARDPDTVRGADVVFISHERLARVKSQSYLDVAPDLIVEILSPEDRWLGTMEKLEEYFAIGVRVVWVVDTRMHTVYVYRSLTDVQRFTAEEELPGGDVLPGFSMPVKEMFA